MNEFYPVNGPEKASEMEVALLYSGVCAWLQDKPVCVDESGGLLLPRTIDGVIVADDHSPHHTAYIDGDLVKKYAPGSALELEIQDHDMLSMHFIPLHYEETGFLDESLDLAGVPFEDDAASIIENPPSLEIQINNSESIRVWSIAPPTSDNPHYDMRFTEELVSFNFEREYLLADEVAAFHGILRHLTAMDRDMEQ